MQGVYADKGGPPADHADEFHTLTVVLVGVADADAIAAWNDHVRALLLGGHRTIHCDVRGISGCAAAVLGALARIRLTARQSGGAVLLLGADDRLRAVLELAGLTDLLTGGSVEGFGQAEDPEQFGL